MEKPEFSCTLLSKLNLDDIEKVGKGAYHKEDGPGRLPRKPMGIFKALIALELLNYVVMESSIPLIHKPFSSKPSVDTQMLLWLRSHTHLSL